MDAYEQGSWELIHQRMMKTFWEAIGANVEVVAPPEGQTRKEYDITPPEGFPPGSQAFFEAFAHALINVKVEQILRNLTDAAMTAVAKEISYQRSQGAFDADA